MNGEIKLQIRREESCSEYYESNFRVEDGVDFIVVPSEELKRLQVQPNESAKTWPLRNNEILSRRTGKAYIQSNGRSCDCEVIFGEENDHHIAGVKILTMLGLFCHPLTKQILPLPRLLRPTHSWGPCGAKEQYQRAIWFLNLTNGTSDITARLRLMVASIYAGRAIVEQIIGNLPSTYSPTELESFLKQHSRHFQLIADARKQDFHRISMTASADRVEQIMSGPIELRTAPIKGATAAMVGGENGMEPILSPGSTMRMASKHDKHTPQPFQFFNNGGYLFVRGGELDKPTSLFTVIHEYLCDMPRAIDKAIDQKKIPDGLLL